LKGIGDVGQSSEDLGSKEQLAQDATEMKASLEVTEQELRGVQAALELDNNNAFLLHKESCLADIRRRYDETSAGEKQARERLYAAIEDKKAPRVLDRFEKIWKVLAQETRLDAELLRRQHPGAHLFL